MTPLMMHEIETPQSMQDSFAAMLEQSFEIALKPGVIVAGEVMRIERDGLYVDIGGKSEGFVPLREVPNCRTEADLESNYKIGQICEMYILQDVDADGNDVHYVLSIRKVMMWKNWDKLTEIQASGEIVTTTVTGITKGGVIVNIMGYKGFVPASQLRVAKTLGELVGDELPAIILEVDRTKNKLILSHREAIFRQKASQRAETMSKLTERDVVDGHVVKITDFGAFIDINGIDGLLPLSEITWRRIKHPSEVLELGQKLTVQVLTVDRDLQRISLSLKRLEKDPWDSVTEMFKPGDVVPGKISKMLGSGALAELTPGVEAYCAYDAAVTQFFVGETYTFNVVSLSPDERRITLGQSK